MPSRQDPLLSLKVRAADPPTDEFKKLARDAGIQHVPLTVGKSPNGPPDNELFKDADVTALMWRGHKVQSNHAFKVELTEKDIRTIVDDIPKALGE
jgi:hypothetical protein